ncbi:hypothetical protein HanPI659440_Chr12g0456621 [Helianthus annuus]|nr:hypothetical protein HanPI659440_Chr12g0456621 [Helianthus annuus]
MSWAENAGSETDLLENRLPRATRQDPGDLARHARALATRDKVNGIWRDTRQTQI